MKKNIFWKILLVLLLVFGGLFIAVMSANNWDFSRIGHNSLKREENVTEKFDNIDINLDVLDLNLVKSNNEETRIILIAHEKIVNEVYVESNTLYINVIDERKWADKLFSFNEMEMTIYLNESTYNELSINGSTGDIDISSDFTFSEANINLTTGDIDFSSDVNNLNIELTTGDVNISSLNCTGDINIELTTGESEIDNVSCKNLFFKGSTGSIELDNVLVSEKMNIQMTTGEIEFDRCDANEIYIKTTTGDVKGSLLSNKNFITHTTTGSVNVPNSSEGGKCEIYCTTGDIHIWIEN